MNDAGSTSGSSDPQLLWLPEGANYKALPPRLQRAITEIINPAYRELVLEEPSALARTSGLSFMYLLWLEMIEQFELGKYMWLKGSPFNMSSEVYERGIARHLRLVATRDKFAKFLLQVKVARAKYGK